MKLAHLAAVSVLLLAGCTPDFARQNDSNLIMRISQITGSAGAKGGTPGAPGSVLHSDVSNGFNDIANVSIEVVRKNALAQGSAFEDVTLNKYEVVYVRSDGRNQEGVDVPYRVTGPLADQVLAPSLAGTSTTVVPIDVVRNQAKFEPPLRNLLGFALVPNTTTPITLTGAGIITTIAQITVYGVSTNERQLSATGSLQITFADFVDN